MAQMTRIQKKNTTTILEAALDVFSIYGFRGSTVDQIAQAAGMSKPNLLYYFPTKDAIYTALLNGLLENWLNPLYDMDANGDPRTEILSYVHRKLDMAQSFPRESRLFANEIIQGAPRILDLLTGELKTLVDDKATIVRLWAEQGKIARIDPYHLFFSIWALTQHYADFDTQVKAVIGDTAHDPFPQAREHLDHMFTSMLKP